MKVKFGLTIWFLALILVLVSCIGDVAHLEGTTWRLVSYGGKNVIPGSGPTLFFEDGSIGGNASCNTFGGNYKARGSQLEIGETFWTLMACVDNDLMDQEQVYMQMLAAAESYEISGDRLVIITKSGDSLVFIPSQQ